jgi:2-polyprenyl-3-methyl-5-hydroxy-6-metoxy-1,4-benzoquinol methylase
MPESDDHVVRRKYILSQMSAHIDKNKFEPAPLLNLRVLDIGCGNLGMSEALTLRGADVTAIDTCPAAINKSQKNAAKFGADVNFVQTTPGELVLQNPPKFDLILCLDVISEAEDSKKFLWAVSKLLKDDGLVVITDWDPSVPQVLQAKLAGITPPEKTISQSILKKQLRDLNLEPQNFTGLHYTSQKEWVKRSGNSLRFMGTASFKTKK